MKIAVYTIAKNEAQFVKTWVNSASEADILLVADTGSTDGTAEKLRSAGVAVPLITVDPWRFDVARNTALSLLPADVDLCITLDMDEVLIHNWRAIIEKSWRGADRVKYGYVWNFDSEGNPCVKFDADRMHARKGYLWKGPVHEVITPVHKRSEVVCHVSEVLIHHHADNNKSRSQYFPLLELAVFENPNDDRASHYLGREYMFLQRWDESIRELTRHLALLTATWDEERSASWRYIARCYIGKEQNLLAKQAYWRAIGETPYSRDTWYEYVKFCMGTKDFVGGASAAEQGLNCQQRPSHYLVDPEAWGTGLYDIGSICAHYAGHKNRAKTWLAVALAEKPTDERLLKNREFIFAE